MKPVRWVWILAGLLTAAAGAAVPHNVILFVPDGLRAPIVDARTAPSMSHLRDEGVNFANSHALFPTFTTANASAFATGHELGDTGDFSNTIYTQVAFGNSVTPFLENDGTLKELNLHLGGNYLNEPSIVAAAAALAAPGEISTALIGKMGPVAIFDPTALKGTGTLIIDDSTGKTGRDIPLPPKWRKAIEEARLTLAASRGDNGTVGTFIADLAQQQYFLEMTLKVVLPAFKEAGKPFVLVYWTRDPDGTQHNQGDGSINGPTAMTAVRAADGALAAIEQELRALKLYESTNIIVAADHGFSTIAKDSEAPIAGATHQLPGGFLAQDLFETLKVDDPALKLFNPDEDNKLTTGNGVIAADPKFPEAVIAANGGSDLIYLPAHGPEGVIGDHDRITPGEVRRIRRLGLKIARILTERDYVSGLFVNQRLLGKTPGALSLEEIGLQGAARTPQPALVVNFRSYIAGDCDKSEPLLCAKEIADSTLPAGSGMHGSASRADTWNFMAARGPDFRKGFKDPLPASNADIGMTVAWLLHLNLPAKGTLTGRVLTESLSGYEAALPDVKRATATSTAAANGLQTVLKTQSVAGHTYYDLAGFPGRTAGLE